VPHDSSHVLQAYFDKEAAESPYGEADHAKVVNLGVVSWGLLGAFEGQNMECGTQTHTEVPDSQG
jgi:hypothetical protein